MAQSSLHSSSSSSRTVMEEQTDSSRDSPATLRRGYSDQGAAKMRTSEDSSKEDNRRLTWSDGQPVPTDGTPVRPSLPEVAATKDSHLSNHSQGTPEGDHEPPQQDQSVDSDTETVVEFREASVPVKRYWLLTVSVCLGLFLSIVDTSIVATSIYTIGMHFEDMRSVNWVALAYTLTYLCFAVTFARVSDVIGRRKAFMAAYIIFFVFSLACGFAQTLPQLIAFRALQGIGGSGLYSLTLIILPELSPRHLKSHVSSIVGLVIACSGAAGPVLGGLLTEYATWRWVFWINGPIGGVSLIAFYFAWPAREQLPTLPKRSWAQFDWLGTFVLIAGAVLVVFPFQNAGEEGSDTWSKPVFYVPLVVGVICLVVLIAWSFLAQSLFNDRILLAFPINLFKDLRYTTAAVVTLLAGFPYLLVIYSFPIRMQVVGREEPLMAGVMLLPMLGTVAAGAVLNGAVCKVRNFTAEAQLAGTVLLTLGCGLMIMVEGTEDDPMAMGFLTFIGLGFGLVAGSASLFTTFECPISEYAPAQGIIAQVRILGGSFGIAASTALTDRRVTQYLGDLMTDEQLVSLGHGGESDAPLPQAQASGLSTAYSKAYQDGMIACVAISAVSILVALMSIRRGKRALVKDLQDGLIEKENRRRSVRPGVDKWEVQDLKRSWRRKSQAAGDEKANEDYKSPKHDSV